MNKRLDPIVGRLVLANMAKIVLGLGAILAFVWQARGDVEEARGKVDTVESRLKTLEKRWDRIEDKVDKILVTLGDR